MPTSPTVHSPTSTKSSRPSTTLREATGPSSSTASRGSRTRSTRRGLASSSPGSRDSNRCIKLLLSAPGTPGQTSGCSTAHASSRSRVQVDWSPNNTVKDLLAYLQQKDLHAVRLLSENTREVGVIVSVVIDGIRTKRSIYNSVVDEVLSIGEASARDDNEMRRKALL